MSPDTAQVQVHPISSIQPGTIVFDASGTSKAEVALNRHLAILQNKGISAISELGTLDLSGNIVARIGIIRPSAASSPEPVTKQPVPISVLLPRVRNGKSELFQTFVEAGLPRHAQFISTVSPTQQQRPVSAKRRAQPPPINIDSAYFVGKTIKIASNTVIVLKSPHEHLTFIAERIVVGKNVTFTYERPAPQSRTQSWPPGDRPARPAQVADATGRSGNRGTRGAHGQDGGRGFTGRKAPSIELWTLELTGTPTFDLIGQDGTRGGRGRDGGQGGTGGRGAPEKTVQLPLLDWICEQGPGSGGEGGKGGNGGDGGRGGDGGHGGRLEIYAPDAVLRTYANSGFNINTTGGHGGRGGSPGAPGAGGSGGRMGTSRACGARSARDGRTGAAGTQGDSGEDGSAGEQYRSPVSFVPVRRELFLQKLTEPALLTANPTHATAGTQVTLTGLRLLPDDRIRIGDSLLPLSFTTESHVSFVCPPLDGGVTTLRVQQVDGTLSNPLSLYVLPTLTGVGQGQPVKPGRTVRLTGSGFSRGARVRVNGEDMSGASFINSTAMEFTFARPASTQENAEGERGVCEVLLPDGTASNEVEFVIDTMRLVVLGDSISWGQGLQPPQKAYALVGKELERTNGGAKVYYDVFAHSGAVIGARDAKTGPVLDGEVPSSYPTVNQQVELFEGQPQTVDLVVVSAGMNDLGAFTVLDPTSSVALITKLVKQHFGPDLKQLLHKVGQRFPKAIVVVTDYFPFVSVKSDPALLAALLVAQGVLFRLMPAAFVVADPDHPLGFTLSAAGRSRTIENCRVVHQQSTESIKASVDSVNSELAETRCVFAPVGFDDDDAVFTPSSLLFGVNADASPQDTFVAGSREASCNRVYGNDLDNLVDLEYYKCIRASGGHPNHKGAQRYAAAISKAIAGLVT